MIRSHKPSIGTKYIGIDPSSFVPQLTASYRFRFSIISYRSVKRSMRTNDHLIDTKARTLHRYKGQSRRWIRRNVSNQRKRSTSMKFGSPQDSQATSSVRSLSMHIYRYEMLTQFIRSKSWIDHNSKNICPNVMKS